MKIVFTKVFIVNVNTGESKTIEVGNMLELLDNVKELSLVEWRILYAVPVTEEQLQEMEVTNG